MFRKFFSSLRYYRLKSQFQQLRFQIFREMEDFDIKFAKYGLGEETRPHLESIMQLFPTLLEKIGEVEQAEAGVGRGNIFDETTYHIVSRREILRILHTIRQTLEEHYKGLLHAQRELSSIQNTSQVLLHHKLNSKLLSEYRETLVQLNSIIETIEASGITREIDP